MDLDSVPGCEWAPAPDPPRCSLCSLSWRHGSGETMSFAFSICSLQRTQPKVRIAITEGEKRQPLGLKERTVSQGLTDRSKPTHWGSVKEKRDES